MADGTRGCLDPESPSLRAIFGIRGPRAMPGMRASEAGAVEPLVDVVFSSVGRGFFCGDSALLSLSLLDSRVGVIDRDLFRDPLGEDILGVRSCTADEGDNVLLVGVLYVVSSTAVSGISVNVSRAGSYAIEDLLRVKPGLVDCVCGSMGQAVRW